MLSSVEHEKSFITSGPGYTRGWQTEVGRDAQADWGDGCGPYYIGETNVRPLESATFNNLLLTNTLAPLLII